MKKYVLYAIIAIFFAIAPVTLAHEGEIDPNHHDVEYAEQQGGASTGAKAAAGVVLVVAIGIIAKKFLFTKSSAGSSAPSGNSSPEAPKNTP